MSLNKVMLIGHLGDAPEVKHLETGMVLANIPVATNRKYKNKAGELKEETDWHKVVLWGKSAEFAEKYLTKGNKVFVEGEIRTRSWDDKDGVRKYITEIHSSNIQSLSPKQNATDALIENKVQTPVMEPQKFDSPQEPDDLPF